MSTSATGLRHCPAPSAVPRTSCGCFEDSLPTFSTRSAHLALVGASRPLGRATDIERLEDHSSWSPEQPASQRQSLAEYDSRSSTCTLILPPIYDLRSTLTIVASATATSFS